MDVTLPDVLDRAAIAHLKMVRLGEQCARDEFEIWRQEIDQFQALHPDWPIARWYEDIFELHRNIWDNEYDLRKGEVPDVDLERLENDLQPFSIEDLARIGVAAWRVRRFNHQRVRLRNHIVETTGTGFRDVRMNS